ncbi:MAG TPA: GTPase ObgE [Verrucomicrobiae bacterium]|nr:GTPase ObgE [Verrucomicrobiae bacterium]
MFVDEKQLNISAGKGGDGAALFRREKYVPYGGPDGGDGGQGGDVIIVGRGNLHAFAHLTHTDRIEAENGQIGGHSRSSGRDGEDKECQVPLGTEIYVEQEDGEWKLLTEILAEGERLVIAKGGNGGWGNWHFKSSIQQAPKRANPGLPGGKLRIKLVLKLIADIGLVGLPNAGKSTLLSVISAAQPKIANYPFTTLEPQLGVVTMGKKEDERSVVVADLPGLIEGASDGKGLGVKFLKHVERTKKILHCIAADVPLEELQANYEVIRSELTQWSEVLATKEEIIVLTKADLILPEEMEEKQKAFSKLIGKPVHVISAATHQGVQNLLTLFL